MNAAVQKLGEAADDGLAAYEKAGVTDPAKLRPLLAMRLASQHPDLLGIWTCSLGSAEQTWVIDFDERTGGFQVEGIDQDPGGVYAVYHGEKIDFKDGVLSFVAAWWTGTTARSARAAPRPP